jgi:cytochrome P450
LGRSHPLLHGSLAVGPHFSLGASLARLEVRIAFTELAGRFPRMELAAETLPYRNDDIILRGVRELALALGAPV